MQATVLVLEDETSLNNLIKMYLEKEGISVVQAFSAEEGLRLLHEHTFDLITLDINLPGMDGFEFLQKIRLSYKNPIIIVSAREADEDIIMGLGIGGDEFVTKPFKPKVLAARVRALIRRANTQNSEAKIIRFKDFSINTDAYLLKKGEKRIVLTTREFDLLVFLLKAAGKTYSSNEIYNAVWGNLYGDITAVGVYIQRIRKKIEADPSAPEIIETVYGKGYRFNSDLLEGGF